MFIFRFFGAVLSGLFKLLFIFLLGIGILGSAESLLDTAHSRSHREFIVAAKQAEAHDLGALKDLSRSVQARLSRLF